MESPKFLPTPEAQYQKEYEFPYGQHSLNEALELSHGITLSPQDMLALDEFQDANRQGLVKTYSHPPVLAGFFDSIFGKILGIAIGVGLSLLPGINLAVGLFIGVAIGGLLGILFQKRRKEDPEFETPQTIGSSPQFVTIETPVPLVFCDRTTNQYGGVRTSGHLLHSRVETLQNTQYLNMLICLSLGELGEIDTTEGVLINDQPLSVYDPDDYQIEARVGTDTQSAVSFIDSFSQVQYPQDKAKFGLQINAGLGNFVSGTGTATPTTANTWNLTGTINNPSTNNFSGASNGSAYATAGAIIPDGDDGEITFTVTNQIYANWTFGLATADVNNPGSVEFAFQHIKNSGFLYQPVTVRVRESGTTLATTSVQDAGSVTYSIKVTGTLIEYFIDGVRVTDAVATRPTGDLHALIVGRNASGQITEVETVVNPVDPLITSTFNAEDENYDAFSVGSEYVINNEIRTVVDKDPDAKTITFDGDFGRVTNDVWGYEKFRYSTTKRVTRIGIAMQFSLWARDKKNNLIRKGAGFEVWVRPYGGNFILIRRIFCQSNSTAGIVRQIEIQDLPLGYYDLELRPIVQWGTTGISHIGDSGQIQVVAGINQISGQTVRIKYERGTGVNGRPLHFQNETQNSNDNEVTGLVTAVNEIVLPTDIGLTNASLQYPGLAVVGVRLKGIDGNASFLIRQGIKIKNLQSAGTADGLSATTTLQQGQFDFIAKGVQVGNFVRNLTRGIEDTITGVTANTITTASSLNWQNGDDFLTFTRESSNYVPDIANALAEFSKTGVGRRVDVDYQINYPSYVASRDFCVANNYFWDGIIREEQTWAAWIDDNVPTSLLIPVFCNGQFWLIPEQDGPVDYLFNEGNVRDVSIGTLPLKQRLLNSVMIQWNDGSDGRFNTRGTLVQTTAASTGTEPLDQETLSFPALTRREQVQDVAVVWLNSRTKQNLSLSFLSDANAGVHVKPAQIVGFNHPIIYYQDELSGFVTEVITFNAGAAQLRVSFDRPDKVDPLANFRACVGFKNSQGRVVSTESDRFCQLQVNKIIRIAGLTQSPQIGDLVIIGSIQLNEYKFRLTSLKSELGAGKNEARVEGLLWTPDIFSTTGLVIDAEVYSNPSGLIND